MFRLIALYIYYRDLQEERARVGVAAATPMMRATPTTVANADHQHVLSALAA